MLRDLDIPYVILGHSERRTVFGESDEVCLIKFETIEINTKIINNS